jgi:activator of HSP90 ATPase
VYFLRDLARSFHSICAFLFIALVSRASVVSSGTASNQLKLQPHPGGNMKEPIVATRGLVPSRRQVIACAVTAAGGLAFSASQIRARPEEEVSHSAEAIHQEPIFKASRKRVYEALTDAQQFDKVERFSADMQDGKALGAKPTEISRQVGGTFTLFGGHIVGRHLELVPSERIVQAWRVVDWEPGLYSIARFELVEQGSGTKIVFDHTGFPKGLGQHLADGWKMHYWDTLQKYLA